jgi:hypothetical protein
MQASKTLDNVNDPSRDVSMSVVDYIRNRINEVELTGRGFVNRKTLSMGSATKWPVGLFLDETPTELSILRTVRVGDVALVKFFDVGWVGVGTTYPGGGLVVYTKREGEATPRPERLPHVVVHGYTAFKPFLHLDYGQKDIRHAPRDHRLTLYWTPGMVLPAGKKNFNFSYYANDLAAPVKIIIEGFDATGKLVFLEQVLE